MKHSKFFAAAAAVAVGGAMLIAATPQAIAEDTKDQATPRDYGVTESTRRTGGPLLLGEFVYSQRCKVCHSRTANGKTTYGPHFEGIVGRKAAATGFGQHSDALRKSGMVWDEKAIDALLQDPQKAVPGTKMETVVRFRRSRKALIAYLKTL